MKRLFRIIMILSVVMLNCITGSLLASTIDISPIYGAIGINVLATGIGALIPYGALGAGLYTEVWTGYMVKAMRTAAESLGWYAKIKDFSQYAENDVIHFVHIGGDPTVLINNTTYPIGIETLADADKAISLDKFQTKATPITDDEVHALSYDKMASVIERHREALDQTKYSKAIHSLAPASNTTATPILLTTGADNADGTRKMITRNDIISLKNKFDKAKVPVVGRILVLCTDHVADLLDNDQKFADQYYNYTSGKISNLYGFEVYEYQDCPYYNNITLEKIAYNANIAGMVQSSVAFFAPRMMKANGTTKTYLSEAKTDPTYQQNLVNFRTYSICLPLKNEAISAIVSAPSSQPVTHSIKATTLTQFTKNGGTKNSTVTAIGEWDVVKDNAADTWFTVTKDGSKVTVVVLSNLEASAPAREGSFTVSLVNDNSINQTVTISQAANV